MRKEAVRPRLFVALPLPEPVTETLTRLQPRAQNGVRLIDPGDMHLTLHFLGQRDVEPVSRALTAVRVPAFTLRLGRPGHFALPGGKTALWVDVEPSKALLVLYRATAEALLTLGFEAETRPYKPHVTVARTAPRAPRGLVADFEARPRNPNAAAFECTRFALYESETRPEGARYRMLESFALPSGD